MTRLIELKKLNKQICLERNQKQKAILIYEWLTTKISADCYQFIAEMFYHKYPETLKRDVRILEQRMLDNATYPASHKEESK